MFLSVFCALDIQYARHFWIATKAFACLQVSSADIMFFAMFNGLFVDEGKAEAPKELKGPLLDLYNRVMNLPNIKAWIDSRPATKLWSHFLHMTTASEVQNKNVVRVLC